MPDNIEGVAINRTWTQTIEALMADQKIDVRDHSPLTLATLNAAIRLDYLIWEQRMTIRSLRDDLDVHSTFPIAGPLPMASLMASVQRAGAISAAHASVEAFIRVLFGEETLTRIRESSIG